MNSSRFTLLFLAFATARLLNGQEQRSMVTTAPQNPPAAVVSSAVAVSASDQIATAQAIDYDAADYITPEIQALSDGLKHDPKLIFDYVHNRIDYAHYFGVKKGAHLTMLEGSGNDFDQSALLVSLLRAAGFTAGYQYGLRWYNYNDPNASIDIKRWFRFLNPHAWDNTAHSFPDLGSDLLPSVFLHSSYIRIPGHYGYPYVWGGNEKFAWFRVWVYVVSPNPDPSQPSIIYYMDPSEKVYQRVNGQNVAQLCQMTQASINNNIMQVGYSPDGKPYEIGTVTSPIFANLAGFAKTFRDSVAGLSNPNLTVKEVTGGWKMVETTTTTLRTTPYDVDTRYVTPDSHGLMQWNNLPSEFYDKVRFALDSHDSFVTFRTASLRGRRIPVIIEPSAPYTASLYRERFDANNQGQPADVSVLTESNPPPSGSVNVYSINLFVSESDNWPALPGDQGDAIWDDSIKSFVPSLKVSGISETDPRWYTNKLTRLPGITIYSTTYDASKALVDANQRILNDVRKQYQVT